MWISAYIDGDEIVDGASITDFIGGLSVRTRHRLSFVMTAKLANRCILLRLPGWRIHRLGPVASLYYYSGVVTHRNYGGGLTFHPFSQAH